MDKINQGQFLILGWVFVLLLVAACASAHAQNVFSTSESHGPPIWYTYDPATGELTPINPQVFRLEESLETDIIGKLLQKPEWHPLEPAITLEEMPAALTEGDLLRPFKLEYPPAEPDYSVIPFMPSCCYDRSYTVPL